MVLNSYIQENVNLVAFIRFNAILTTKNINNAYILGCIKIRKMNDDMVSLTGLTLVHLHIFL